MKKPLEYLAKGLGVSHTALWVLLLAALVVWLAMGAPMPQVGPAVPRQQQSQLVELWNSEFQNFTQVQNCPPKGQLQLELNPTANSYKAPGRCIQPVRRRAVHPGPS